MRQYRGETLIVVLDGNIGTGLAPSVDKLLDTRQILAGLTIRLSGLANHDALHSLGSHIPNKIIEQLRCQNSCQPASYQLQRVGNC